jgi:hypothetical protein
MLGKARALAADDDGETISSFKALKADETDCGDVMSHS